MEGEQKMFEEKATVGCWFLQEERDVCPHVSPSTSSLWSYSHLPDSLPDHTSATDVGLGGCTGLLE